MDEDMSELRVEFRAQRTLLQALHDTQQEHSATLSDHGAILREHSATLSEHSAILQEHGAILRDHSAQLTALQTGQQRIMAGVDAIREMLDRTLNSGN
jgi:hypothetical protein